MNIHFQSSEHFHVRLDTPFLLECCALRSEATARRYFSFVSGGVQALFGFALARYEEANSSLVGGYDLADKGERVGQLVLVRCTAPECAVYEGSLPTPTL